MFRTAKIGIVGPALALLLVFPAAQATEVSAGAGLQHAEVRYQTVPREYRLDGVVEAINRTTVSAQTQGQVEEILYDVDDVVNKGDVIARLRDSEHRTRVARAAAELKSATAELDQVRDEFGRMQGLHKTKNVSDSEMDKAETALTSAQARLESAEAGLRQYREQLRYTEIRAPYSGIVIQRHVELGEIASSGQAIMTGISLDQLRVIVDVPQTLIPAVREFGEVKVQLPTGAVVEPARITVFPFADMGSNTFKIRLDLPERTPGLFPGMFVKTSILTGRKEELTVPKAAVVYRSEVTGVYVLDNSGDIRLRQIRVGRPLGNDLVVLSGLSAGEKVALDPIAAGVALKTRDRRVGGGEHSDE
ncbi:MAG: efflux RND transporter periplasmic adaptor subunit [Thiohalocapsa sp.]